MPLPPAFWNSSGKRSWPVLYEYQTSACSTGGSVRRPVLFRESLIGPKQLNSSPDCGAFGVKSKSTYGWFGVMQNGQP